MDYFFYNTDASAIVEEPRPRFPLLINEGFAAVGGDRERFGIQLEQLEKDDLLLMYENGVGVVAIGQVKEQWDGFSHDRSRYYTPGEMRNLTGGPYEYRITVNWFLDLSQSPITVQEIKNRLGYTPRGAVRRILEQRAEVAKLVQELQTGSSLLPEEIAEPKLYIEGAVRQVSVDAYERNSEARRVCKEHYGTECCICGFSFGATYGPVAAGYIHIHHLRPLSEVGGAYKVDPKVDLRPVCPNCHAVLHLGDRCRTIEEVKKLMDEHAAKGDTTHLKE
jgi:hypothetical protein